ncbi:hypothetical protein [Pelagicoccus mobilis]|uniref:VWA domain-containing protein n=1 Tax=Pelagicoccus mobilis TaxID=415221 RepID=A0A934VRJ0_9BACT|nr:hypothetical protein [Pelagicoccus mobilis]MBK1878000.1 hypothetical protein [Pelagicoccus mobilis]
MKVRKKAENDIFGLSFMDCICCGFGAVILMFILTTGENSKEASETKDKLTVAIQGTKNKLKSEEESLAKIEAEIASLEGELGEILSALENADKKKIEAEEELTAAIETQSKQSKELQELMKKEQGLAKEIAAIKQEIASASDGETGSTGKAVSPFQGDGRRHYLTGMKVDGERVAILVDTSSSMVSETVSGVAQFYGVTDPNKLASRKWTRILDTVDWLMATNESKYYQVVTYNQSAQYLLPKSAGDWLPTNDPPIAKEVSDAMWNTLPNGGSNLEDALELVSSLSPKPDNVFVITDSLPTHSGLITGATVNEVERVKHFQNAYRVALKNSYPMNVILFPLDGDFNAPGLYWKLADATQGSLFTPSPNWPN